MISLPNIGDVLQSAAYVISAPGFWRHMGFLTASTMFIGALLYDGNMKEVRKGLMSVGVYAGFLFYITINRIAYRFEDVGVVNTDMAYAGIVSILIISGFYVLGLFLGVFTLWIRKLLSNRKNEQSH